MKRTPYHVIEFQKIKNYLGAHYQALDRDSLEDDCICGERVGQDVDKCPHCRIPVIWYGSRVWRRLYGNAAAAEQRLSIIVPDDSRGEYLMRRAKLSGFANETEAKRWERAVRNLNSGTLTRTIDFCARRSNGRGLVAHVLNTTDKQIREQKPKRAKAPPPRAGEGVPRR